MYNYPRGSVMEADMASDEVTDLIALIELHRQETQKEAGLAAACNEALRKLHELLASEKASLQQPGQANGNPANVEAVSRQIQRTRNMLSGGGAKQGNARYQRPQQ